MGTSEYELSIFNFITMTWTGKLSRRYEIHYWSMRPEAQWRIEDRERRTCEMMENAGIAERRSSKEFFKQPKSWTLSWTKDECWRIYNFIYSLSIQKNGIGISQHLSWSGQCRIGICRATRSYAASERRPHAINIFCKVKIVQLFY